MGNLFRCVFDTVSFSKSAEPEKGKKNIYQLNEIVLNHCNQLSCKSHNIDIEFDRAQRKTV